MTVIDISQIFSRQLMTTGLAIEKLDHHLFRVAASELNDSGQRWRAYISESIHYCGLEDCDREANQLSACAQFTAAVADDVFGRIVDAAKEPSQNRAALATAIYEFITFTEARGWHFLFFEVPESALGAVRSQGFQCVRLGQETLLPFAQALCRGDRSNDRCAATVGPRYPTPLAENRYFVAPDLGLAGLAEVIHPSQRQAFLKIACSRFCIC